MDGDGDTDRASQPEPPAFHPDYIQEQERRRLSELAHDELARRNVEQDTAKGPSSDPDLARQPAPPAFTLEYHHATGEYVQPEEHSRRLWYEAEKAMKAREARKAKKAKKRRQEALARRRYTVELEQGPSETGSIAPAGAGTATHVRQSVLYSDRPRRSRSRRGQAPSPDMLQVEEHAGEVSNSELEALTLSHSPPTLDSTDRSAGTPEAGTATRLRQSVLYSDRPRRSRSRRGQAPSPDKLPAVVHAGDMDSGVTDSTIAEPSAAEEALSPRSERMREIKQYLDEHTFDDLLEGLIAVKDGFRSDRAIYKQQAQAFWASEDTSEVAEVSEPPSSPTEDLAQCAKPTKDDIIQNAKKWMGEEVMLAFYKYIEGRAEFENMMYDLDELQHQCFSVETYEKIFHHFNFTVKTKKKNSDDDWSLTHYFAQVKEMYGRKFYYCYPLEPHDDGYCRACKNQGMDALKHPAHYIGFDMCQVDTGCPFMYFTDDDLEE